jgi:squalene-associated FAD-dependent desaturase
MSDPIKPLAASQSDCANDDTLTQAELEPVAAINADHATKSVAIIGGGLAGMAAATVACEAGLHVDLFEQGNHLGGRACSMQEPWNGQTIDQCQHVAMGCCTNFLDFCRRTGVENCFQRHKTLHFIGLDGAQSDLSASWWLPAPYHLLPGLFRLNFLTWRECCEIILTLKKISCLKIYKENEIEIFKAWLRRQGQSEKLIEKFWSVILNSALSETVNFTSLAAVKKVFTDGFFSSRRAYELIIPRVPLVEIFDRRASSWLELQGVRIHRGVRVMEISCQDKGDLAVLPYDGTVKNYPAVIVAVPWFEAPCLLSSSPANLPLKLDSLKQILSAAITAVHLWFDRPITNLPHAALVGRLSQWIFNGTAVDTEHAHDERGHGTRTRQEKSHYYQVVISAAHRVVKHNKEELLKAVLADLRSVFSEAGQAELLNARIVEMPRAVFSMQPGVDRLRPPQTTAVANLFLAGDWTATGWPGTMEGAVKSGYLAAQGVLHYLGK